MSRKFELDKRTKGAIRYREVTDGEPIVGTIYVRKSALPKKIPDAIIVSITFSA